MPESLWSIGQTKIKKALCYKVACIAVFGIVGVLLNSSLLILAGLVVGSFLGARVERTDRLVLWLRRFKDVRGSLPMRRLIAVRSNALFNVLTLQDKSYGVSYLSFITRWETLSNLVFFPVITVALLLPAVLLWLWLGLPDEEGYILLGLISASLALGVLFTAVLVRRLSPVALKSREDLSRIDRLAARVRSREGSNPGVVVFSTSDEVWKDAVCKALPLVDGVLVEISEPSDNLRWELRKSLELLGPDKLVVLLAHDGPAFPEPAAALQTLLGRSPTSEETRELTVIQYERMAQARRLLFPKNARLLDRLFESLAERTARRKTHADGPSA